MKLIAMPSPMDLETCRVSTRFLARAVQSDHGLLCELCVCCVCAACSVKVNRMRHSDQENKVPLELAEKRGKVAPNDAAHGAVRCSRNGGSSVDARNAAVKYLQETKEKRKSAIVSNGRFFRSSKGGSSLWIDRL